MLSITLHQMRTGWVRLIAAGLAIMLGTGFVAASILGGEVMKSAAYQSFTASYAGADLVVSPDPEAARPGEFDPATVAEVAAIDGVGEVRNKARIGSLYETPAAMAWVLIGSVADHDPSALSEGALPAEDDEVALSAELAGRFGIEIGDALPLEIIEGDYGDADAPVLDLTVSGVFSAPLDLFDTSANALVTPSALATPELQPATAFGPLALTLEAGVAEAEVAAAVADTLGAGYSITSVTDLAEAQMEHLTGDTNTMRNVLLGFAGVALAVAALVIANTFSVLVANRTRQLALLRTVGASRGQVRRSVLLEALLLGLAASIGGLALGYAVIAGAITVVSRSVPGINLWQGITLGPGLVIATIATGVVLTLIAGWAPARAATRVRPLEALRPEPVQMGTTAGKFRATISALAFLGGVALLIGAVVISSTETMVGIALALGILGGFLSVFGVVLGSVFLITPVVRLLGRLFGSGVPATVATMGAVRNPRRTATTTNALFIGVGLVAMMATGAATAKTTFDNELTQTFPIDMEAIAVDSGDGTPALSPDQISAARDLPQIAALAPMAHTVIEFSDGNVLDAFAASQDADAGRSMEVFLTEPSQLADLGPGEMLIPEWLARGADLGAGDTLTVAGTSETLTIGAVSNIGNGILTTPETLADLGAESTTRYLWADLAADADVKETMTHLEDALIQAGGSAVTINSSALEREAFATIIDTLLLVVTAMLAVAIIIALVGVANTLSLSVLERRRESATLRALGLTTGQLRGTLAIEGVLIALVGALVGVLGGLAYGWAGATTVLGAFSTIQPVVPWLTIAAVLATAIIAGLVASVLPARTAVRVSPVAALAQE